MCDIWCAEKAITAFTSWFDCFDGFFEVILDNNNNKRACDLSHSENNEFSNEKYVTLSEWKICEHMWTNNALKERSGMC